MEERKILIAINPFQNYSCYVIKLQVPLSNLL